MHSLSTFAHILYPSTITIDAQLVWPIVHLTSIADCSEIPCFTHNRKIPTCKATLSRTFPWHFSHQVFSIAFHAQPGANNKLSTRQRDSTTERQTDTTDTTDRQTDRHRESRRSYQKKMGCHRQGPLGSTPTSICTCRVARVWACRRCASCVHRCETVLRVTIRVYAERHRRGTDERRRQSLLLNVYTKEREEIGASFTRWMTKARLVNR